MARRLNMNTHLAIRNATGTSGDRCGCGGWLTHWKKHARSQRRICAVVGCSNEAQHGAHVEVVDRRRRIEGLHIVPLCSQCNHRENTRQMYIPLSLRIVPAAWLTSCG